MLFTFNRRATWSFLGLLVLMHFVLFVDRVNLAAAAPVMQLATLCQGADDHGRQHLQRQPA